MMSLFQFGFRCTNRSTNNQSEGNDLPGPSHMPSYENNGLGRIEYEECISQVSDLADPNPSKKKRRLRSTYITYTPADRANIGKYASENGNKNTRLHFLKDFPNLNESTVGNFKKAYIEKTTASTTGNPNSYSAKRTSPFYVGTR